jgi:hypothetical protein
MRITVYRGSEIMGRYFFKGYAEIEFGKELIGRLLSEGLEEKLHRFEVDQFGDDGI